MSKNKNGSTKVPDSNLPLVSVILGGASIFSLLTVFTGIPAIILGVMALRKNVGNRTMAKLGIGFGIFGTLLIIPIVLLAAHLLRQPFSQQFSVNESDQTQIVQLADALNQYRKETGAYPLCNDAESPCAEWEQFITKHPVSVKYPIVFESEPYEVQDREAGTLVYVNRSACFINTPVTPGSIDEDENREEQTEFASLVYFYKAGRACFNVHAR